MGVWEGAVEVGVVAWVMRQKGHAGPADVTKGMTTGLTGMGMIRTRTTYEKVGL